MTPDETPHVSPERPHLSFDAPHLAFGFTIAIIGVALTLDRLQILDAARILRFWPVGLILVGQAWWPRRSGLAPRHQPAAGAVGARSGRSFSSGSCLPSRWVLDNEVGAMT